MCGGKKIICYKVFMEWQRYVTDAESSQSCQQEPGWKNKCEAEWDLGSSKKGFTFFSLKFSSFLIMDGKKWNSIIVHRRTAIEKDRLHQGHTLLYSRTLWDSKVVRCVQFLHTSLFIPNPHKQWAQNSQTFASVHCILLHIVDINDDAHVWPHCLLRERPSNSAELWKCHFLNVFSSNHGRITRSAIDRCQRDISSINST